MKQLGALSRTDGIKRSMAMTELLDRYVAAGALVLHDKVPW